MAAACGRRPAIPTAPSSTRPAPGRGSMSNERRRARGEAGGVRRRRRRPAARGARQPVPLRRPARSSCSGRRRNFCRASCRTRRAAWCSTSGCRASSGLDFQAELARAEIRMPIVFMTGHGDIPMSVRAMKAGAVDFLTKPFRDQDMLDAVAARASSATAPGAKSERGDRRAARRFRHADRRASGRSWRWSPPA